MVASARAVVEGFGGGARWPPMRQSLRMPSPSGSVVAGAVAESPFVGVLVGGEVAVVGGGAGTEGAAGSVSVKVRVAGVGSVLSAASVARTGMCAGPQRGRCSPWGSCRVSTRAPGPSRRHSKVEPGSEAENTNAGEASSVDPTGPASIVVSGGVVSTVNVRVAGVGSVLPGRVGRAHLERVHAVAQAASVVGDVQARRAVTCPASTRHSKVAPASEREHERRRPSSVVPDGPEVDRRLRRRPCRP